MKFLQLATHIRKTKEYVLDKKFYDAMISSKQTKMALDRAEALDKKLTDAYEKKKRMTTPRCRFSQISISAEAFGGKFRPKV
jgi:S-methylmethionine-dependent homocysteine/selenocysteine methylase